MLREREEMMHCKIENQNKRQGDTKACECVCGREGLWTRTSRGVRLNRLWEFVCV